METLKWYIALFLAAIIALLLRVRVEISWDDDPVRNYRDRKIIQYHDRRSPW